MSSNTENTISAVPDDATLHTNPETDKKEHGILRQILNPGGKRYDEMAYGDNATVEPTGSSSGTTASSGLGSSDNRDSNGVVQTAAGPRIPGSSISNPGLASAAVNDGTTDDSSLAEGYTQRNQGLGSSTTGTTSHNDTPMRSVDTAAGSRIPGSSITGPGHASAAVADGSDFSSSNTGATSGPGSALPDIPATGGTFLDDRSTATGLGSSSDRSFPLSGSSNAADPGLGGAQRTTDTSSGLGRDAALVGGAGAAGAAGDSFLTHTHLGHGHQFEGPNLGNTQTPVALPGGQGPHVTAIANLLDPHASGSSGSTGLSGTTGTSGLGNSGLGSTTGTSGLGSAVGGTGLSDTSDRKYSGNALGTNTSSAGTRGLTSSEYTTPTSGTEGPLSGIGSHSGTTGGVGGIGGHSSATTSGLDRTEGNLNEPNAQTGLAAKGFNLGSTSADARTDSTASNHPIGTTGLGGVDQTATHALGSGNTSGTTGHNTHSDHHDGEKKEGFLSKLLHRHKDDSTSSGTSGSLDDRNRLHKDPPS